MWPSSETNVRSTERSENKEELSRRLSQMEFSDRRKTFSHNVICFQPTSPTSQDSCDSLATVSHTMNWQVLSSFVVGFHTVRCHFNRLKPPSRAGPIRIRRNCDGRVWICGNLKSRFAWVLFARHSAFSRSRRFDPLFAHRLTAASDRSPPRPAWRSPFSECQAPPV